MIRIPTPAGKSLDIPGAPDIPGLLFRRYAGEDDIPAMAEVANAFCESQGDTERFSVVAMRAELRNPSHVPPGQGVVLAFVGERLVAFSSIEYSDTTAGERYYASQGHVHPEWARRGIGGAMLAFNEAALRELARQHQHRGPRVLTSWLHDTDAGGVALHRARGYSRQRVGYLMVRPDLDDVDTPAPPGGLAIRPVGHGMLPSLWAAMVEAFRDHPGGHDGSAAAYCRWAEDPRLDLDLLVVAFDGDQIAGGVQGVIDPDENTAQGYLRGWADPVFTRRPWRRRGLAYALLGHTLHRLKERGMTSAQLGVDAHNPNQALSLYERHRFEIVRSASQWHKDMEP